MKISFKLADVNYKQVKLGGAEIEFGTDEHDTARLKTIMEGYPKFITEIVDTIKTQVLPIGDQIGEFLSNIESSAHKCRATNTTESDETAA